MILAFAASLTGRTAFVSIALPNRLRVAYEVVTRVAGEYSIRLGVGIERQIPSVEQNVIVRQVEIEILPFATLPEITRSYHQSLATTFCRRFGSQ